MKTLIHGLKLLLIEKTWVIVLWIICVAWLIYIISNESFGINEFIFLLHVVIWFPIGAYYYGKREPTFGELSNIVPIKTDTFTMRVINQKADIGVHQYNYRNNLLTGGYISAAKRDPGYLGEIIVEFNNQTGGEIQTDTSFLFEKQRGLKWYDVVKADGYDLPWEELTIPEGVSKPISLSVIGRYDYLPHGSYRILKAICTCQGEIIISAPFTIDWFNGYN